MVAAKAASVLVLQQFILIAMIQAGVLTIFGWRIVRQILFPLAYLYFAVPFGEVFIAPLRDLAALLIVLFLNIADVSAILDGYLIRLPTADYRIAEACAGLRFFIVGIAVSFLAANLLMRSWWRRLAFLALAFCVPVLANALRAASVIYLEQKGLFDAETLFGHLSYGLGFTSVVLAVLIGMAYFMRDRELTTVQGEPDLRRTEFSRTSPTRLFLTACVAVNVTLIPQYWPGLTERPQERGFVLDEPRLGKNWHLLDKPIDSWHPTAIGADRELRRSYVNGDKDLSIYIALYFSDRQDAEAISDRHQLVENNGWLEAGRRLLNLEVEGNKLPINASKIKLGGSRRLVLSLYWIDNNIVGNPFVAKYLQAKQAVFGRQPRTAVITLSSTYNESAATAAHILRQYVSTSTLISLIHE
jgi:EpsI family protein